MGAVLAFLTPSKTVSSVRIESDQFLESSASLMAASKSSRDVARQENDEVSRISQDDIRRYSTALHDVHEYLGIIEDTLHRQKVLEDELRLCQER